MNPYTRRHYSLLSDARLFNSPVGVQSPAAMFSGLPIVLVRGHSRGMGTKSRETIYGSSIRASAERAAAARKEADRLACEAWNQRMLGYKGPAQPSPSLGDALTHQGELDGLWYHLYEVSQRASGLIHSRVK
jgi:hypothetical protein